MHYISGGDLDTEATESRTLYWRSRKISFEVIPARLGVDSVFQCLSTFTTSSSDSPLNFFLFFFFLADFCEIFWSAGVSPSGALDSSAAQHELWTLALEVWVGKQVNKKIAKWYEKQKIQVLRLAARLPWVAIVTNLACPFLQHINS